MYFKLFTKVANIKEFDLKHDLPDDTLLKFTEKSMCCLNFIQKFFMDNFCIFRSM